MSSQAKRGGSGGKGPRSQVCPLGEARGGGCGTLRRQATAVAGAYSYQARIETGGDVEAAKARALAAHLARCPQDVGREIEWMVYRVEFVEARPQPADDELAVKAVH
jgi:hypothetical protein